MGACGACYQSIESIKDKQSGLLGVWIWEEGGLDRLDGFGLDGFGEGWDGFFGL